MDTLVFSSKAYDRTYLALHNKEYGVNLTFQEARLSAQTVSLCAGYQAICVFVNDQVDAQVIKALSELDVKHIALRCAGFNNIDLIAAKEAGISISRVPAYSPEAVAEHTLALMMTLNRKIHKAYNRVRENNFSLEGLEGFNFYGKTIGIIGYGKIGQCVARVMAGLGCKIVCSDPYVQDKSEGSIAFVSLPELFAHSDIISLHCPLTPDSQHLINAQSLAAMKDNVMLINTSRGGLIDTRAVINALKSHKIGYLGLDVYEMESDIFFEDKSWEIMQDDMFDRLIGFPNVVVTGHQGFFTQEALHQIATTTLSNLALVKQNKRDEETFLV